MIDKDLLDRLCCPETKADLVLDGHVGDQPVHILGVDPRRVACVRVAVRIAVLAVKKEKKFITIGNRIRHLYCSLKSF